MNLSWLSAPLGGVSSSAIAMVISFIGVNVFIKINIYVYINSYLFAYFKR
jgi:hypothetical protein